MARNELRIISGKWKGRKLRFADRKALRPTLGRARETLFNWLAADIVGARCVDLFGGSGALGFEAASRGAASVTIVENDRHTAKALSEACNVLASEEIVVHCRDALAFLRTATGPWDIVFLDPPFHSTLLTEALTTLAAHPDCLTAHSLIYWEAAHPPEFPAAFEPLKERSAGDTSFGLLRVAGAPSLD